VGAGYAGLAAARTLTDESCSTVVLEARDRVGGRTHTVEEAGARVDLGGQWIGPGQDHILLHVLFYIRSGGGWESLANTEGGAQQDRLVAGLQEPAVRLAARLGDAIRLDWPVRAISQDSRVVVVTGEAGEFAPTGRSWRFRPRSPDASCTTPRSPVRATS
jgi:monoamine oxidase